MRMKEVLGLKVGEVDLTKKRVTLRVAGGGDRQLFMHKDARKPLRVWLRARGELGLDPKGPLFCSLHGKALSASYVRRVLPQLGKAAGIKKRVYTDGLRHTFASMSFNAGVTVHSLKVQFGHDNIFTTVTYLERIGLHAGFSEFDKALG